MAYQEPKECKAVFVGDSGVGKTSLFQRLESNAFVENQISTIGGGYTRVTLSCDSGKVECNLWDTAGQEKYRTLIPMYFHGATFVIIVFDVTSRSSFEDIEAWMRIVREQAPVDVPIILLGNKCDLLEENSNHVQLSEIVEAGKNYNAILAVETSALTGVGIDLLKKTIAHHYLEDIEKNQGAQIETAPNQKIDIKSSSNAKCCD